MDGKVMRRALGPDDMLVTAAGAEALLRSAGEGRFSCPACNREVVLVGAGTKEVRFEHVDRKPGCTASGRLRMVASLSLKERFDSGLPVTLSCVRRSVCSDADVCASFRVDRCCKYHRREYVLSSVYGCCDAVPLKDGGGVVFSDPSDRRMPLRVRFLVPPEAFSPAPPEALPLVEVGVRDEEEAASFGGGRIIGPDPGDMRPEAPLVSFSGGFRLTVMAAVPSCRWRRV